MLANYKSSEDIRLEVCKNDYDGSSVFEDIYHHRYIYSQHSTQPIMFFGSTIVSLTEVTD